MNNIYKVIWSKAKNCYVVASEIAKSHTKSASGSEKMGGYGKKALLALVAASAIFCGGLVNVGATVHVNEGTGATSEVYTTGETYNKTEVDLALAAKGAANDVASNRTDIDNLKTAVGGPGSGLTKDVADQKADIATNRANINNLDGKLADLTTTVSGKADEAAVTTALDSKADTDLSNLTAAGETKIKDTMSADMAKKANEDTVTALGERVGGVEGKVTALENTVGNDSRGLVKDVNDLNTAIGTKVNQSDLVAATDRITANEGNITELQRKTQKIDYDVASDATNVNGMKVGQRVDMGGKDLTRVGAINGTKIGRKVDGTYIHQDSSIWGNMQNVDTQVKTNADNIETNKTAITKLDTKVGKVGAGTYLDSTKSVGDNLGLLNEGLQKEVADRKTADAEINKKIGSIDNNQTEYVKEDQTISQNLTKLDNKLKDTNDRTGGITRNDAESKTIIEKSVTVDSKGNVTADGKLKGEGVDAGAGAITTTGAVNAGSLNVTNGATNLQETTVNGALTAKENATFEKNVTVQNDLTVNGKLNVGEISMKNNELKNGKKHDSATTITADEISNLAKVTEQGNTTESQFTHNEKGTFNHARDGNNADWKESNSNVTADGVFNKMTDSDGNRHTYYQTAAETKEQLVNGNKSNFEKKTAKGNTISIKDKDADGNKKSLTNKQTVDGEKTSVTNKDSSSTVNQGADQIRNYVASTDGTKSSTEVKADGITNTSDGTITNDANHIENKANTMDTTVTGKATESYGELETTVNGNETHTVTGNQTNKIDGNQENTIGGNQTTTVEGKVTENYKAGQATNVTGDQDITVSGTQTTTATDIKRNASSGMIDTIDNDYGTNKETKVAGKTTTDVSIKGTGEEGKYIRGANESRDYLIKGTLKNSETKTAEATSTEITDGNGKTSATIQDVNNLAGSVTNGTETGVSGIHANDNSVSIDSIVTDGNKYSVINQKKGSIQSTVVDGTNSTVILQDKDNVTIASSNGTVGLVGKDIVNNAQNTITNTAGTSITNQVKDSKVTTDVDGTTFENKTAAVSDGGTTTTKISGNHINTGRVDANELGVSDKDDQGNTADFSVEAGEGKGVKASASNGTTTGSLDVTGDKVESSVKDGDNETSIKQTATDITNTAKDGTIKNDAKDIMNEASKSITNKVGDNTSETMKDGEITTSIKDGAKKNTVISTADGTSFFNSEAWEPVTGASGLGTAKNTTIKGNTITTGKVTMDYADVMKDLGVRGNANITGTTTTKTLNVTENATVGGKLDVTGKATFSDDVDIANNLSVGKAVTAKSYKVGEKTYIDENGIHANGQKITDVANGSISEGSKDAVNGGQLYTVKNDLEGKVNKVGANAAAMANLHPMEFDPDSKWNIAAAIGNYGSETAAALGAFYRPNDDVMVNLSTAFGTGENMVGGGVSVRLGKGGNKLSREESNALKDQVNDLTARMDALLSVLNPNMSKDFPDVPENHWAYEAVSRLAGNDIVQGYPDGEFHGERTMTRYEMAEIIYNALSRGAEAEKELVEEFKPELQAMAASEKATAEKSEG